MPNRTVLKAPLSGVRDNTTCSARRLEAPHDARRAYGLVGRDLDKSPDPDQGRGFHHVHGSEHVGLDGLKREVLQNRDVFVGGRMKHHFGPVALEDLEQRSPVRDVHQGLLARTGNGGGGVVQMGLVVIEEHQEFGVHGGDLTAQLGADRATRAGDQNPVAGQGAAHGIKVGGHGRSPEEVFDLGFPGPTQGRHMGRLVDHVLHSGQHLHGDAGGLGGPQGSLHEFRGRRGNGQEYLLDGVAGGGLGDVFDAADHRHTHEGQAVGPGIVIEDGDGYEAGPGAAQHLPHGGGAGIPASDDGHAQPHPLGAALPGEEPRVEPDDTHADGGEHAADHDDGRRHSGNTQRVHRRPEHQEECDRGGSRHDELAGFVGPGVPPDSAVETEQTVAGHGDKNGHHEKLGEVDPVVSGRPVAEVDDFRHAISTQDAQHVEDDKEQG